MSEWKEKTLGELSIRVSSGLTPLKSNKEFWENPIIPWLKTDQLGEKYIFDTNTKISKEALEQTSLRIYPENTISIAMYGEGKTRGNLSIIKAPMTTNQACCNIELDTKLADVEYVYYYLKTQYDALRKLSSGVRKNLSSNDIKNYKIYIPESVSFQKSIVRILTSLDNKISVNNQINQELEAMAKTLYDYWFVQFDFPDQNGKPYKSSGGKMVYNPELKREIPEGWGVTKVGELQIATGKRDANFGTENGKYDFEALEAVDLHLFETQMNALLHGEKVDLPEFDFITGKKIFGKRIISIDASQPIVIEGIHGLNPQLTEGIDDSEKFKIYISPLTQINLDAHHRIPTTDARMLRRMVRDNRTRGRDGAVTISSWPSVRHGEEKYIFPFNKEADVFFNSQCVYELAVLKKYATPLLEKVQPDQAEYAQAQRMLQFLSCFKSIDDDSIIANNSIIREFIGGSILVS